MNLFFRTLIKKFFSPKPTTSEIISKSSIPTNTPPKSITIPKKETLHTGHYIVAGLFYHQEAVANVGKVNPLFDQTRTEIINSQVLNTPIYKYFFNKSYDAELLPEPENEYDPNAIKVIINNNHIGYIKKSSTALVDNVLNNKIVSIKCTISGGPYKILTFDATENKYHLNSQQIDFTANLTIKYYSHKV